MGSWEAAFAEGLIHTWAVQVQMREEISPWRVSVSLCPGLSGEVWSGTDGDLRSYKCHLEIRGGNEGNLSSSRTKPEQQEGSYDNILLPETLLGKLGHLPNWYRWCAFEILRMQDLSPILKKKQQKKPKQTQKKKTEPKTCHTHKTDKTNNGISHPAHFFFPKSNLHFPLKK